LGLSRSKCRRAKAYLNLISDQRHNLDFGYVWDLPFFKSPGLTHTLLGGWQYSGIMTFIVSKDGTVYQKDLGEKTADLAVAMAEYNPGDGWSSVVGTEAAKN